MQSLNSTLVKDQLIGLKAELLNKSDAFIKDAPKTQTEKGDEAEQASSDASLNLSLRLHERDQLLVQKIDYALSKLNNGDFGLCDSCEAEIEEKRLAARPYTTLCIACKEEQEHHRRFFA